MARTLTAKRARTILWGKLGWHPAVNAWIAFADGAGMPDTIEVLRDGKQSATYRLVGAGPNGESVIAQRVQSAWAVDRLAVGDRKSTRLNSSHDQISYAVFCLKKKKED